MSEMEIRQPKQIALRVGETPVFSTQDIENCVKAGMTEYLRADIPAAQIARLIDTLEKLYFCDQSGRPNSESKRQEAYKNARIVLTEHGRIK